MQKVAIRAASMNDLEQLNDQMFELHDEHHRQCPEHFKSAQEIEQEKSIARYIDDPECIVLVACATILRTSTVNTVELLNRVLNVA